MNKSKLKKKTEHTKYKNGYQQGVDIKSDDMNHAKKIASKVLSDKN